MSDEPERIEDILWRRYRERKAHEAVTSTTTPATATPPSNVTPLDPTRVSRYVEKAVDAEFAELRAAPEGARNDALNKAAFSLGQIVAAGALDEQFVRDGLTTIAATIGLNRAEVAKTITSGLRAGAQQPRDLSVTTTERREGPRSTERAPFGEVDGDPPDGPDEPDDDALEGFWAERPLLTHIQQAARARMTSPWAVLGCVLARVVTATPHTIVLPPIVGSVASLNTFVGLVGSSGDGKGAAERVASECLQLGVPLRTATPGSGEGLTDAYKERRGKDEEWVDDRHAVLFTVPEIDTLAALGSRQGSTLMPELRRAWSGESLGHHYRDKTKRITVEAQQYRLCLVAGVQPQRARALLDDADGGTPQRFVWASAIDPNAPDVLPEWPAPLRWRPPHWARDDLRDTLTGKVWMSVPPVARETIIDARRARVRGEGDALDGHLLLCQLKVAAAFAIADGRLDILIPDWDLAALLIAKSNSTRARVALTLERERAAKNRSRGIGDAERALIIDEQTHNAARERVMRRVLRKLAVVDDMARRDLSRAIAQRDRGMLDEAIDELVEAGKIRTVDVPRGVRYARV